MNPSRLASGARWVLATLIYLGIACVLAAAASWFIGRLSPRSLAIGLMLAAILALVLGAARLSGLGISREATYQLGQSAAERRLDGQIRHEFTEAFAGSRFMAQMAAVALACIALSLVVEVAAR